jgi:hypothetical protein
VGSRACAVAPQVRHTRYHCLSQCSTSYGPKAQIPAVLGHLRDRTEAAYELLDLGDERIAKAEVMWNTLFLLTLPNECDYFMSQALSRHIASEGLAGFLSPTAMHFSMLDRYARNVVLFSSPVSGGHLPLRSLNRTNVIGVHYNLQFGPVWDKG